MKIALMQPYFFPYLGYFQQIQAVDSFIFYDDVNFIKQGWINRNRILMDGIPKYITVPLSKASSFRSINETHIHKEQYCRWREKLLRSLQHHYNNCPYFGSVFRLVENILSGPAGYISSLAIKSVTSCSDYLGIETDFKISSQEFQNNHINGEARVLDICKKSCADVYLNSAGGGKLYDRLNFEKEGIRLQFIHPQSQFYKQSSRDFVPKLSIIDIMMNCSISEIQKMLNQYTLT